MACVRGEWSGTRRAVGAPARFGCGAAVAWNRRRNEPLLVAGFEVARLLCRRAVESDLARRWSTAIALPGAAESGRELESRRGNHLHSEPRRTDSADCGRGRCACKRYG